jgi:hypothetical protein
MDPEPTPRDATPRRHTMALIADACSVRVAVEHSLRLCTPTLRRRWQWHDDAHADLLLIAPTSPASVLALARALDAGRRCAVLGDVDGDVRTPRLSGRISPESLTTLLEQIERDMPAPEPEIEAEGALRFGSDGAGVIADAGRGASPAVGTDDVLVLTDAERAAFDAWEPPIGNGAWHTEPALDPIGDTSSAAVARAHAIGSPTQLRPLHGVAAYETAGIVPGRVALNASHNDVALPLVDYLELAKLRVPALLRWSDLPALVFDPRHGVFHCEDDLLMLEPYLRTAVPRGDWRPLSMGELTTVRARAPAQRYERLRWLNALLQSDGRLAGHLDPGGTFRLTRWFQLTRDRSRHFRIATSLLRPRLLHEVAAQAQAAMSEVFDVVNAYEAIGLIEVSLRPNPLGERRS